MFYFFFFKIKKFIEQHYKFPQTNILKTKKKGIIITTIDSATLEHPSPAHIKEKVVVITANKNKILEKFLK